MSLNIPRRWDLGWLWAMDSLLAGVTKAPTRLASILEHLSVFATSLSSRRSSLPFSIFSTSFCCLWITTRSTLLHQVITILERSEAFLLIASFCCSSRLILRDSTSSLERSTSLANLRHWDCFHLRSFWNSLDSHTISSIR